MHPQRAHPRERWGEQLGVSRWREGSRLSRKNLVYPLVTPLMADPPSPHIFPFPREELLFHFTSWDGCPTAWKNTCGRTWLWMADLDALTQRPLQPCLVGSVEYNQNIQWPEIRICPQCGRPGFDPWVGKIPRRRERLPTPVSWPGEFHGLYSPTEQLSLSEIRTQELRLYPSHTPRAASHGLLHLPWNLGAGL